MPKWGAAKNNGRSPKPPCLPLDLLGWLVSSQDRTAFECVDCLASELGSRRIPHAVDGLSSAAPDSLDVWDSTGAWA
jgi:hypothetical protein